MLDDMFEDEVALKEKIEEIAKESVGKASRKKAGNTSPSDLIEDFKASLDDFLKTCKKETDKLLKVIKDLGGQSAIFKKAWNVEEEETPLLKFEDVVRWAKTNVDPDKHSAVCLTRLDKREHEYHLVFLNKDNKPLLDGSEKHKIFYAKAVDDALKAQLQGKDMLVLK